MFERQNESGKVFVPGHVTRPEEVHRQVVDSSSSLKNNITVLKSCCYFLGPKINLLRKQNSRRLWLLLAGGVLIRCIVKLVLVLEMLVLLMLLVVLLVAVTIADDADSGRMMLV